MFKAIVLDLFDTLVNWDPDGLPLMNWKGRDIHSTMPWILPKVAEALGPKYDRDVVMAAYGAVYEEINHERERDGIEITCFERFVRTLQRLGLDHQIKLERLAEELTRIHMRGVRNVTSAPAARKDAVRRLAERYRLGLLSNFDDSQTGWEIMAVAAAAERLAAEFTAAMDDDLDTPRALAALMEFVREANAALDAGGVDPADRARGLEAFDRLAGVLQVVGRDAEILPAQTGRRLTPGGAGTAPAPLGPPAAGEDLDAWAARVADERRAARMAKDWPRADLARQLLADQGYEVRDGKDGRPRLLRKRPPTTT